jgi:hypothetical protein
MEIAKYYASFSLFLPFSLPFLLFSSPPFLFLFFKLVPHTSTTKTIAGESASRGTGVPEIMLPY